MKSLTFSLAARSPKNCRGSVLTKEVFSQGEIGCESQWVGWRYQKDLKIELNWVMDAFQSWAADTISQAAALSPNCAGPYQRPMP